MFQSQSFLGSCLGQSTGLAELRQKVPNIEIPLIESVIGRTFAAFAGGIVLVGGMILLYGVN